MGNFILPRSLPASTFTLTLGSKHAWLAPSNDLNDFFYIQDGWDLSIIQCELRRLNLLDWCLNSFGEDQNFHPLEPGIFTIDTTSSFDTSRVCIGCDYNGGLGQTFGFRIRTSITGACSEALITLSDVAASSAPTFTSGSKLQSADSPQILKFAAKEETSGNNCVIDSIQLVGSTSYAELTTMTLSNPDGHTYEITPSSELTAATVLAFRIRVNFSDGFFVILDEANAGGIFTWSFTKTCLGNVLTQDSFPNSKEATQWVDAGANAQFALPQFTTADAVACPITSYTLSSESDSVVAPTGLEAAEMNADPILITKPSDTSFVGSYTFFLQAYVNHKNEAFSEELKLIVGCPPSEIDISFNFEGAAGATQFVAINDAAATKFELPTISTPSPTCPLTGLSTKKAAGSTENSSEIQAPSGGFVVPFDISLEQSYQFWILAEVGAKQEYSSMFTLVVGCPNDAVSISEGAFTDSSLGATQYVKLDGAEVQEFVLPDFTSSREAEGCPIGTYRTSSSGAAFSAHTEVGNPVFAAGKRTVALISSVSSPQTFSFFVEARNSLRTTSAHGFSQAFNLVIGCDSTWHEYGFTLPTIATSVSVPKSSASTTYNFGVVVSTLASCPVTDYIISSNIGSNTAHPELTSPTSIDASTLQVAPTSPGLDRLYEFYIGFRGQGMADFVYMPDKVSLQVGCSAGVQISPGPGTSKQFAPNPPASDSKFTLPSFMTREPNCEISLQVSSTTGSVTVMSQLGAPTLVAGGATVVVPTVSDQIVEFFIKAETSNSVILFSEKFTLVVGCPAAYTMTPQVGAFPNALSAIQSVIPGDAVATKFYLPVISPEMTYCPLDFSSIRLSSEGSAFSSIAALDPVSSEVLGGDTVYYVRPSSLTQAQAIKIFIEISFQNGQTVLIASEFRLVVGCPSDYSAATITEDPFPGGYSASQSVHPNDVGFHATFYRLNLFSSSIAECPPTNLRISSSLQNLQEDLPLHITQAPGEIKVVPDDISLSAHYTFYMQASSAGRVVLFQTKHELWVGCRPEWTSISELQTAYSASIIINSGTYTVPSMYTLPTLASTGGICEFTGLSLITSTSSVFIDPGCSSNPLCTDMKTNEVSERASFDFQIELSISLGQFSYLSPMLTLEVTCDSSSTVPVLPSFAKIDIEYLESKPFQFNRPTCSVASCCRGLSYKAFEDWSLSTEIPEVLGIEENALGKVEITFNSSYPKVFSFVLQATNEFQSSTASAPITAEVHFTCYDDKFDLSHLPPSTEEVRQLQSLGIFEQQSDSSFRARLSFQIGRVKVLEVDLSKRFTQIAPSGMCLIADYRIAQVVPVAVDASSPAEAFQWTDHLSINSHGVLSIDGSKIFPRSYVLIQVYNGAIWSSQLVKAALNLEVTEESLTLPNLAPSFMTPRTSLELNSTTTGSRSEMKLPEVFDGNGDPVEVVVKEAPDFISYDQASHSLAVDPQAEIKVNGTVPVILELRDGRGGSTEYAVQIHFFQASNGGSTDGSPGEENSDQAIDVPAAEDSPGGQGIMNPVSSFSPDLKEPKSKPDLDEDDLTASISGIDKFGLIKVKFSEDIKLFDLHLLNSSSVSIEIDTQQSGEEEEAFIDLVFIWKPSALKDDLLLIQLTFESPLNVSLGAEQDLLNLRFTREAQDLLYSPALEKTLADASLHLTKKVPKQMPDNAATRSLEKASGSTQVSLQLMFVISFFFNYVLQGGLRYMLLLIRSLQIILHIPLFRIIIPSNVGQLFSSLVPVATFDVLDPDWTTKLVYKFDEERQTELQDKLLDQMVDLGYETHNSILNLGSLYIFTILYFLQLASVKIILLIGKRAGFKLPKMEELHKRLVYGDLIAILIDAYFEFLISGYLQIKQPLNTTDGEVWAIGMGVLSFILIIGFMGYAFLHLMATPLKTIRDDPDFKAKWGQLYDDIKPTSKLTLAYFPLFAGRRLLFVWMAFSVRQYYVFQVLGLIFINTSMCMFVGMFHPFSSRLLNRIELTNEAFVAFATVHLLCFTDWVTDEATKFRFGWSMTFVITCLILFNLYFVVKYGVHHIRLVVLRYWGRRRQLLPCSASDEQEFCRALSSLKLCRPQSSTRSSKSQSPAASDENGPLPSESLKSRSVTFQGLTSDELSVDGITDQDNYALAHQPQSLSTIGLELSPPMKGSAVIREVQKPADLSFGLYEEPPMLRFITPTNFNHKEEPAQDIMNLIMGQEVLRHGFTSVIEGQFHEFDQDGNLKKKMKVKRPVKDAKIGKTKAASLRQPTKEKGSAHLRSPLKLSKKKRSQPENQEAPDAGDKKKLRSPRRSSSKKKRLKIAKPLVVDNIESRRSEEPLSAFPILNLKASRIAELISPSKSPRKKKFALQLDKKRSQGSPARSPSPSSPRRKSRKKAKKYPPPPS